MRPDTSPRPALCAPEDAGRWRVGGAVGVTVGDGPCLRANDENYPPITIHGTATPDRSVFLVCGFSLPPRQRSGCATTSSSAACGDAECLRVSATVGHRRSRPCRPRATPRGYEISPATAHLRCWPDGGQHDGAENRSKTSSAAPLSNGGAMEKWTSRGRLAAMRERKTRAPRRVNA